MQPEVEVKETVDEKFTVCWFIEFTDGQHPLFALNTIAGGLNKKEAEDLIDAQVTPKIPNIPGRTFEEVHCVMMTMDEYNELWEDPQATHEFYPRLPDEMAKYWSEGKTCCGGSCGGNCTCGEKKCQE